MAEPVKNRRRGEDLVVATLACLTLLACTFALLRPRQEPSVVTRAPSSANISAIPSPPDAIRHKEEVLSSANSVGTIGSLCMEKEGADQKGYQTVASMIRIQGGICKAKTGLSITEISGRNTSNGFSLEFMKIPKSDQWTSNYFQLKPGENAIELNMQTKGGTQKRQVRIFSNQSSEPKN